MSGFSCSALAPSLERRVGALKIIAAPSTHWTGIEDSGGDHQDSEASGPAHPRPAALPSSSSRSIPNDLNKSKTACQRMPTVLLALSSSEQLDKGGCARLPTALRPSRPVQHRVFHQAEKQLTPLPVLRYGFAHRKGRLKILYIPNPPSSTRPCSRARSAAKS